MDEYLVQEIDRMAALESSSRSAFLRRAATERLELLAKQTSAPKLLNNKQLEQAFQRLRLERSRRYARAELKKLPRMYSDD